MGYDDVIKKLRKYALECPWCGRKCATNKSLSCHIRTCPKGQLALHTTEEIRNAMVKALGRWNDLKEILGG